MVVTPDSNPNRENAEFIELTVNAWRTGFFTSEGHSDRYIRDASMMVDHGFAALEWGYPDLARECMSLALPQLLEDLGPNGPEETADTFVPMSSPRIEPGGSVGQTVIWGWSAEMKANWWVCVGLCRWVLENRHDSESFANAGECLYRWVKPAIEGRHVDNLSLCAYTPIFVAAGQFGRALEHFVAAPKFKPPRTPGMARTQRAMAYALCQHHAGVWTDEQIEKAWSSFVPAIVFTKSPHHTILGESKALWIKMRYWDALPESARPTGIEAFRHFIEDDANA